MSFAEEQVNYFKKSAITLMLRNPTPKTKKYYDKFCEKVFSAIDLFYQQTGNCPKKIWIENCELVNSDKLLVRFCIYGLTPARIGKKVKNACTFTGMSMVDFDFERDMLLCREYPLPMPY